MFLPGQVTHRDSSKNYDIQEDEDGVIFTLDLSPLHWLLASLLTHYPLSDLESFMGYPELTPA